MPSFEYRGMTDKQQKKWLSGYSKRVALLPKFSLGEGERRRTIKIEKRRQNAEMREKELTDKLEELDFCREIAGITFKKDAVVFVDPEFEYLTKIETCVKQKVLFLVEDTVPPFTEE